MKVLCVGDSWSAGYGIDPNESWPCILSSRYNLNLNNASCSGSDNKYFLDCGHPNAKGNELWASYLGEFIFD